MLRIIEKRSLREFWEANPDSEQHLKTWYETAKQSNWSTYHEIKETYRSASVVGNDRVVFNIKGNDYGLIVKFNLDRGWAFIRFIGTHKAYDKIDAKEI